MNRGPSRDDFLAKWHQSSHSRFAPWGSRQLGSPIDRSRCGERPGDGGAPSSPLYALHWPPDRGLGSLCNTRPQKRFVSSVFQSPSPSSYSKRTEMALSNGRTLLFHCQLLLLVPMPFSWHRFRQSRFGLPASLSRVTRIEILPIL